jgi:hypothetical protein
MKEEHLLAQPCLSVCLSVTFFFNSGTKVSVKFIYMDFAEHNFTIDILNFLYNSENSNDIHPNIKC